MNVSLKKNGALEIVRAAKTDRREAEALVLALVGEIAPTLGVRSVAIKESKLSLNSVSGSMESPSTKYFFKFHAEEGETETLKNSEYYTTKVLSDAGWPVIEPIFSSVIPGSQFVVYEYISAPTAFELYEKAEQSNENTETLLVAEKALARKVRDAFIATLELSPRSEIEAASLNQLFYRRLVSKDSRLESYYRGREVSLPGAKMSFGELARKQWIINGIRYEKTLDDSIERAKELLNPAKEKEAATVIGHGDDHNGNRFFINGEYKFFDAAFAGRQHALLSTIKATAHNVFVHPLWLYDPERLENALKIEFLADDDVITITHNWSISPLRERILDIYSTEIWRPLLATLKERGWLPDYWREYIRSALFCCPFLVQNLIYDRKYSPPQSLLALSKCVELGSKGDADTLVERFLSAINPKV